MKTCILVLSLMPALISADDFWETFQDGQVAEISSYKTVQPRYGEDRKAETILIFVPEHVSRTTRIKVEDYSAVPEENQVQVVKLNRVLRFNTGMYDYAAMTSVFTPLHKDTASLPLKISLAVTEWCGNFYTHLLPQENGAKHVMHSYFQSEGDKHDFIEGKAEALYEDNLPILIREFNGAFMKEGEKRRMTIMPSLWMSRITHKTLGFEKGWIKKGSLADLEVGEMSVKARRWEWRLSERTSIYWTEADYPHRIVKWEMSNGEKGELVRTVYKAYWALKDKQDNDWRDTLGLD
ncbi:MAG: hypothetical protein GF344_00015 [Chitinivibrionales bacterium]|nr:hypothetical protein [Chitinivibrionales bacterium]MBD3355514.1 hypothetical protein [Chitinivibrionales bacterium]